MIQSKSNNNCQNCALLNLEIIKLQRTIAMLNCKSDTNNQLFNSSDLKDTSSNTDLCSTSNVLSQIANSNDVSLSTISNDHLIGEKNENSLTLFSDSSDTDTECTINQNLSSHFDFANNMNHENMNVFCVDKNNQTIVEPLNMLEKNSFNQFNIHELDKHTQYTRTFNNRIVAYYGEYDYNYSGIIHKACPANSNMCLTKILEHVNEVAPHLSYNSIMITKYRNGRDHLPYHSDNEPEIIPHSDIFTISLGDTRYINFRAKNNTTPELSVLLNHGDSFIMSCNSQDIFEHSIPSKYSRNIRISITLRNIKPKIIDLEHVSTQIIEETLVNLGKSQKAPQQSEPATKQSPKSQTVYISSSMFHHLDANKLSTEHQSASVCSTLERLLEKF